MDTKSDTVKKEYVDIVNAYRRLIEASGIRVHEMYVFGSRVKGTDRKGSDLDVGVISADFDDKDLHGERVKLMHLRDGISDLIEPHPFLPEDFNSKYHPLAVEIRRTGVKIV